MKYVMELSARVSETQPVNVKHEQVITFLKKTEGSWGIPKEPEYPVPGFGHNITAFFNLTRKLGKGIRGNVMYRYRNMIIDHHSSDDRIWIEFNATRIDFNDMITKTIYEYIEGFNAYATQIYPRDLIHQKSDIPFEIRAKLNHRKNIDQLYPFHYMDAVLIKNSLGYTIDELYALLKGKIFLVEIPKSRGGIILKASDKPVNTEETIAFNKTVCKILGIDLPAGPIRQ